MIPPANATEEEKRAYLDLISMRAQGKEVYASEFYEPNQEEIWKFHLSTVPQRWLWGGNQSGKTTANALEIIWALTGRYPSWYPLENRLTPPVRIRIIVSDYEHGIGKIWEPKLGEWEPKGILLDKVKHGKSHYVERRYRNGSVINFMTHEQSITQYTGAVFDLLSIDEPCPHYCYTESLRGLSGGVHVIGTFTPDPKIPYVSWLEREYKKSKKDPDIECFFAETAKNPHISQKYIEIFSKTLSNEEKLAKLMGRPVTLLGRVFPLFDENIHVIPRFAIPIQDAYRVMCIDHHSRNPDWILWLACMKDGEIIATDELKIDGEGRRVKDVCNQILWKEKEILNYNGIPKWTGRRWIDNSALTKDEASGRKIISHYRDFIKNPSPTAVPKDYKSFWSWEPKMNEYLYYQRDENGTMVVEPKFYVFDNCVNLIDQLQEAIRDNFTRPQTREEKEPREEMKVKNVCLLKNLKYLMNSPSTRFHEFEDVDEEDMERLKYVPASEVCNY